MAITLAQAQAQLDAWLAASLAVASNQEYEIAGRRWKRADAAAIGVNVDKWQRTVDRLTAGGTGGARLRGVTPV